MKIVKSFISPYITTTPLSHKPLKSFEWGLGDDGILYYRFRTFEDQPGYNTWYKSSGGGLVCPSLKEMKLITKEFGHLLSLL